MNPENKFILLLPILEERPNLIPLLKSLKWDFVKVIILIDSPQDGTIPLLEAEGFIPSEKIEIVLGKKQGLGKAIVKGLEYSLRFDFDYLLYMDSDFSHRPKDVLLMLNLIDPCYDFFLGSRYIPGGRVENWNFRRRLFSQTANLLVRTVKRIPLKDCTTGLRVLKKSAVKWLVKNGQLKNGYIFQVSTLKSLLKGGFKGKEIPITFVDRKKGKSKLSFPDIKEAGFWLLNL